MLAPIEELVRHLARLPGLGRRSAGRAALALLREPDRLLEPLVLALRTARDSVVCCPRCGAFTVTGQTPCAYCADPLRDGTLVCGPEKLRLQELKDRIAAEGIREVLLALSTDMEGDATAGYLAETLQAFPSADAPVTVTRLAFGLPADSGVAYSDPLTLRRAIVHRCAP